MTKIQRQALRELKQRNKYHQRCERERSRHNQRMNAAQSLPRVAVAWLACFFVCASCAIVFSGALVAILANCGC